MKATQDLWRITLDTNPEDCNLRCVMCEEHSPHSDFIEQLYQKTGIRRRRMPFKVVEKIFEEASELGVKEIIPSTMGEPLIYKDFDRILELCHQYDIRCNITTNGTFPKRSAKNWAERIVPVTSDIKLSWNGATKETSEKVMLELDFEKAVQNTKDFIEVRDRHFRETGYYCRVTFQLTFMQHNMHELGEIVKLAAELGVDRVKGHQLWAHFEEIKQLSFRESQSSIIQWNSYVDEAYEARDCHRKPNGKKVLLEQITKLQADETAEVPEEYACPFWGKEVWVSPTGKISPCCAPDEQRKTLGDFGNIKNQRIEDAMASDAYQYLLQNYKSIPLCKTCNMRKPIDS